MMDDRQADATGPVQRGNWWVLITVGIGTFMSALDGSVVNTVLPVLEHELGTTVAVISWVPTIYLLVVSALLLTVGRAGDLYGQKRLYVLGLALFLIGSALCGTAPTAAFLIGMRGLQGVGAAILFACSPALLTRHFPARQRGRALGAQATFTYLGLTVGPSLGGWLADAWGWRWIFYINVPTGAIALLLAARAIPADRGAARRERFDVAGAFLFMAGLTAVLVALNQGHAWGWVSVPSAILTAIAVAALVAFVRVERTRTGPMLDLSLFRRRTFSASTLAALCNYASVYCALFVLPFLLIQDRGLSPRTAGLVLSAQPVIMAVVAPISGALSDRIGSRSLAVAGMLVFAVGLLVIAQLTGSGSPGSISAALLIVGAGIGLFVSPNNSALMGSAPADRQGIAAGILAAARNVGMVLGVALATAILTSSGTAAGIGMSGGSTDALVHGVRVSMIVAGAVAVLGGGMAWLTAPGPPEQRSQVGRPESALP